MNPGFVYVANPSQHARPKATPAPKVLGASLGKSITPKSKPASEGGRPLAHIGLGSKRTCVKSLPDIRLTTSDVTFNATDMRVCTLFLLCITSLAAMASERQHTIDLDALLADPSAMQRLVILYLPNFHDKLFVYGNGHVVFQSYSNHMQREMVPTCTGSIETSRVASLVAAMSARHFFALPEKEFIFQTASDDADEFFDNLKMHTIIVDDGKVRAKRSFAEGLYAGKREAIPADFAAIEVLLENIRNDALKRPCRVAHALRLPEPDVQLIP